MCILDLHACLGTESWALSAALKWPESPQQCTLHFGKASQGFSHGQSSHGERCWGTVSTVLNDTRLFGKPCLTLFPSLHHQYLHLPSSPLFSSFSSENLTNNNKRISPPDAWFRSSFPTESCTSLIIVPISSEHSQKMQMETQGAKRAAEAAQVRQVLSVMWIKLSCNTAFCTCSQPSSRYRTSILSMHKTHTHSPTPSQANQTSHESIQDLAKSQSLHKSLIFLGCSKGSNL